MRAALQTGGSDMTWRGSGGDENFPSTHIYSRNGTCHSTCTQCSQCCQSLIGRKPPAFVDLQVFHHPCNRLRCWRVWVLCWDCLAQFWENWLTLFGISCNLYIERKGGRSAKSLKQNFLTHVWEFKSQFPLGGEVERQRAESFTLSVWLGS
jgi:hypothetical protein